MQHFCGFYHDKGDENFKINVDLLIWLEWIWFIIQWTRKHLCSDEWTPL